MPFFFHHPVVDLFASFVRPFLGLCGLFTAIPNAHFYIAAPPSVHPKKPGRGRG
jgi:hypothetical protein